MVNIDPMRDNIASRKRLWFWGMYMLMKGVLRQLQTVILPEANYARWHTLYILRSTNPAFGNLPSGVVNLSEEIGIIILGGISVLSQPEGKDEEVTGEENGKETDVVNSEPLVGTIGGEGGRGGEDGGDETGSGGGDGLHHVGAGGRKSGLHNIR
mmetsp:Transcript_5007/g.9077  ORF Transcript_5007/g.9077 Transcript_5007/m.9077 type:complete len:155 (-) Transcript_5007:124-588(-)